MKTQPNVGWIKLTNNRRADAVQRDVGDRVFGLNDTI